MERANLLTRSDLKIMPPRGCRISYLGAVVPVVSLIRDWNDTSPSFATPFLLANLPLGLVLNICHDRAISHPR